MVVLEKTSVCSKVTELINTIQNHGKLATSNQVFFFRQQSNAIFSVGKSFYFEAMLFMHIGNNM
jgi:hypothetical protein